MPNVEKAYAISDAKISFVSLVDKAANKKKFLIKKADDGSATFTSYGRILKADAEKHFVTGIVYEPMVEDTDGNYMTEDEIAKAAHWYMKNQGSVDIQHCFEKADGVEVVESYVTKCDMELEGEPVKKGTWIMTAEITDSGIWDAIQKGEITGFSMGGYGVYSDVDTDLSAIEKEAEPKGLLQKLAKAMGFDVVEKGAVKSSFQRRVKDDNFYSAWYALRDQLQGNFYNPDTGVWEWGYDSDENAIKEALADFNDIVTQLLTSDGSIVKSLEKAAKEAPPEIMKAGRSISNKNLQTLQEINDSLSEFLSSVTQEEDGEGDTGNKEGEDMSSGEIQKMVSEEIKKAMEPVMQKLDAVMKEDGGSEAEDKITEPEDAAESIISKMISEEIKKAMEPVTQKLDAIAKSRALPGNLNDDAGADVQKSEEQHYMAGMF